MTTRNFRVKNGLSVGDITISASANTITGLATAAPSADGDVANKKYVDDQINAISTTSITTDSNATNATVSGTGASGVLTITANSNEELTVNDSGMQLGGSGARVNSILDEDNMASNSATALATQQSIKAYVDAQVTASDLDFQADSGGALSIDLDSETLTFTGGTGIDTSGSGNAVTFAIDSTVTTLTGTQTLTNKTLTTPVISSISNTGTLTLPTSTDTLVGRATTDTLTNKTINSASNTITITESNISDLGSYITASSTDTLTNKTFNANGTGNSISNIEVADLATTAVVTEAEGLNSSDNDTSLPTTAAVKDYVDNGLSSLSSTTITEGETSVVVADSGTGTITLTADGNTELVVNDTSATFSGNVIVSGDFTVNGTTTTVATTNTVVSDSLMELANGTTGAPANDAGIVIERGDQNNAFIGFDESEDKFKVGTGTFTGASTGNLTITTGTLVANLEGNVTGAVTGNASTATTLQTARTIGGVSFNGSANINLPGVNTAGNQDTSGNAATATALETARTIGGVSFNGTANINLPGVNTTGNQNTSGTAAVATTVALVATNTTNATHYITFVDAATGNENVRTDTNLTYNPSTNVLTTTASAAQYADVAERFEADAPMEIGTVVEVGGTAEITEATSEMSQDVFGVISHKPAYMMNSGAGDDETHPFVAMTGRTPVRVVGAVTKGQRLVTSSTKGCARAAQPGESISPFNVIGRALETNTEAGIKLVNCAVRTNN
jgi:hypothetical protein